MTDFTQLMDPPPPTDWPEAGSFRGACLADFEPEDRAVLLQAGKILALSAIAGDPESDPAEHYRAAVQDARALAVYLREVRELATEVESRPSRPPPWRRMPNTGGASWKTWWPAWTPTYVGCRLEARGGDAVGVAALSRRR